MTLTGNAVWLADALRQWGLQVIEQDGWQQRGHGDLQDLLGVVCHHTGGGSPNDWQTVLDGRPDLPGPLANLVVEKDGTYRVIAAGVAWHAGAGSWSEWPTDQANYHTLGIEAVSRGTPPWDWTAQQLDAFKRGAAALLFQMGRPGHDCVGHHEYSSEGKIDPAGIDMDSFRHDVQTLLDQHAAPLQKSA